MTTVREWLTRLRARLSARGADERLGSEIQAHLDLLTEEYRRRGLPPAEAARAARRDFGGLTQTREAYADARPFAWLDHLARDIRHGVRALRRNPGFTLVAVATLALGIGANAAIFTLVNALLFRPLPVANADRLTVFGRARSDGEITTTFSFAEFTALRTQAPAWSGIVAVRPAVLALTADNRSDRVTVSFVSENYFDVLGVRPSAGALFRTTDPSTATAEPALVLTDTFWRRRFNADPAVVGKPVSLGGTPVTIVGVGPRGFTGDSVFQDVAGFLPLHAAGFPMMVRTALRVLGPLAPGATLPSANASLANLSNAFADAHHEVPDQVRLTAYWERYTRPNPHMIRGEVQMAVFFGLLSGLVLLLASVNVANLVLARTIARRPELALRSALGAPGGRLALHLLVETLLLVTLAGAFGVVIGQWATLGITGMATSLLHPFAAQLGFGLDWRVAFFAVAAVGVTTLVVGVIPAVGAARRRANVLSGARQTATLAPTRLRTALMAAEIAGAVVLLVIAGLFARSLSATRTRQFGFDDRNVYDFSLNPGESGYRNPRAEEVLESIRARVASLPGVTAAAISQSVPMTGMYSMTAVTADAAAAATLSMDEIGYASVSPSYFDTLRIPLRAGRVFTSTDTAGSVRVAVVTAAMAEHYWPDGPGPIGRTFQFAGSSTGPVQVVGVIGDVKNYGAMQDHESPFFYLPIAQHPTSQVTLQVRSTMSADTIVAAVNTAIHDVAPDVIPYDVEAMAETIEKAPDGLFLFRLGADLAGGLGLIGLALAVVGVFGVVAYHAAQRTREMALRMALGATAADVRHDVLLRGGRVVAAGLAIGLVIAFVLAVMTQDLYVGIDAVDPLTFGSAIVLVGGAALAACYVPARRAMRTDLIAVLRSE